MALERIPVTPASVYGKDWTDRLRELPDVSPLQGLRARPGDAVLVVGAHPDDETFGAGATIAALARSGVRVHGLCMSAGEAALDHLGRTLGDLAGRRRREYAEACHTLGMASSTTVGLPDGRLDAFGTRLQAAVADVSERLGADCLLAVWWDDPHPDHRAVGRACLDAGASTGRPVFGYPVWAQHWTAPEAVFGERHPQRMRIGPHAEELRRRAVDCYRSQTEPLHPDLQPVMPPEIVRWRPELVLAP